MTDNLEEMETKLLPPTINLDALKLHVMAAMRNTTENAVMSCRDLIGGNSCNHFEPVLKLFDALLLIGLITDEDIIEVLKLIQPAAFDEKYQPGTTSKGMMDIELSEEVKIQMCNILDHMCDIQLRHRIESMVSFCEGFTQKGTQRYPMPTYDDDTIFSLKRKRRVARHRYGGIFCEFRYSNCFCGLWFVCVN